MSGFSKSRCEQGRLPINSSAGLIPVVVCAVFRYWNKKLDSLSSRVPVLIFFNPLLRVCTALSARPFEAGWYGAVVTCLMPLEFSAGEHGSIVCHNSLRESMRCKNLIKFPDGSF